MTTERPHCKPVPVALFLGGLDPSGGAGILRDAAVASCLGAHAMAIALAETIQNGLECTKILPPSANPLERLDALSPHLRDKWGAKLSMFCEAPLLDELLPRIKVMGPSAAIWDPIVAPTHGTKLHSPLAIRKVFALFSGGPWVVSPNLPEARLIAGEPERPLETVAKKIMDMGAESLWIRGGHGSGDTVQDLWCDTDGIAWLPKYERLEGDPRGTGCTVTSAWLAFRLNGTEPAAAAESAVQYIREAWGRLHVPGSAGRPVFLP